MYSTDSPMRRSNTPITYVYRQISPIVIRTVEKVPIRMSRSPSMDHNQNEYWKRKYYDLQKEHATLSEQYRQQLIRTQQMKSSDMRQISDLLSQSQSEVFQLKSCLNQVDKQLNDDYQKRYHQVSQQLEIANNNYGLLQQQLKSQSDYNEIQSELKKCRNTIEYLNIQLSNQEEQNATTQSRISQLLQTNQKLSEMLVDAQQQTQIQQMQNQITQLDQELSTLRLKYSEQFHIATRMQDQLSILALQAAEIQSLRNLVIDKDAQIQQLNSSYLQQYKRS